MELLGMDDLGSRPASAPDDLVKDQEAKKTFFNNTCLSLVKELWHPLNVLELSESQREATDYPYCCGMDSGEEMIGCELREGCENNEWFHFTCKDLDPSNLPAIFLCSAECKEKWEKKQAEYKYCFCHKDIGGAMVQCDAADKCISWQWYHLSCVNLEQKHLPDLWYCCNTCYEIDEKKRRRRKSHRLTTGIYKGTKEDFKRSYCWLVNCFTFLITI